MLRTRLIEEDRYHTWRRIAIFAGLAWLPLFILSLISDVMAGGTPELSFYHDPGPYARYLFAIPLLVAADVIIDPLVAEVVKHFNDSGLIPSGQRPAYLNAFERMTRLRDSMWVEAAMIVLALGLSFWLVFGHAETRTAEGCTSWMQTVTAGEDRLTCAAWWYLLVSAPLLQLLLYRWFWRFIIWSGFLYRVSRIELEIQSTHPDQCGGLGKLARYQLSFGVVFTAVSAMMSTALATDIMYHGQKLAQLKPEIFGFVIASAVLVVAPLLFFSGRLIKAKRRALSEYGALGYQLSRDFHSKWITGVSAKQKGELLDTADASAMADYTGAYGTVSTMRLAPINPRGTTLMAGFILAPFLPLVFTQFSLMEILRRLAQTLV